VEANKNLILYWKMFSFSYCFFGLCFIIQAIKAQYPVRQLSTSGLENGAHACSPDVPGRWRRQPTVPHCCAHAPGRDVDGDRVREHAALFPARLQHWRHAGHLDRRQPGVTDPCFHVPVPGHESYALLL